jgi:hypothetical protein
MALQGAAEGCRATLFYYKAVQLSSASGAAGPVSALHLPWLVRANFLAAQRQRKHLCRVLAPPVIFVAGQPSDPHSKLPPHWGSLQERISWVDLKLFLAAGSEIWRLVAGFSLRDSTLVLFSMLRVCSVCRGGVEQNMPGWLQWGQRKGTGEVA